jgi:hypothetical protein
MVIVLAATATHHHLEPRKAAIIVNGTLARKMPKMTNFPNGDSGKISATSGTNMAAQQRARQSTPTHPAIVL